MGIFAQVWFWSALAFVAGALLSWALLALPARRQLAQLDRMPGVERESAPLLARPSVPPLPERPGRFDDDLPRDREPSVFDDEPLDRRPSAFDDEPEDRGVRSPFEAEAAPPVLAPEDDDEYDRFSSPLRRMDREQSARTELMSGLDASGEPQAEPDAAAERGSLRLSGQSVSGPTVQVPVSGSLDDGVDLFAPPEPPIPSVDDQPPGDASATQYLPAVSAPEPAREIAAPPEVDKPGDRGWFEETGDGGAAGEAAAETDESLVDDLDVDREQQADAGELVDDVEDIEAPPAEDTGTIFTQRTQPVSGELISRLDGKPEESSSDTPPAEEVVEEEEPPPAPSSASQPTSVLPVRKPGANRFDTTGSRSPKPAPEPEPVPEVEATQAMPAAAAATQATQVTQAVEPEGARSLFEPIVPADESATTAMPAPGAAQASGDGAFVPPGPFGPGSAMPLPGGAAPSAEFTVKASVTALRYCEPDSPLFGRTVAEVWFRTTKDAERVGFRPLS